MFDLKIIPYTATSLSVVSRFVFMYLIYRNKSVNSFSLAICLISLVSSGMWVYYSVKIGDTPITVRSSIEMLLLTTSSTYIIRNKLHAKPILP